MRISLSAALITALVAAPVCAGAASESLAISDVGTSASSAITSSSLNLDASTKKPSEYWQKAVAKFRSEESSVAPGGTLLLGDSITARWPIGLFPGDNVINRGIGGDHIGGWNYLGLLDRMDTSVAALRPSRIFLLIGVNDMLENGPPMENMVEAYGYLLDQLKLAAPDAEIIVQSIMPVSKPEFAYMHEPIIELNKQIKRLAGEKDLRYVDLYSRFKDASGKLRPELTGDGVHLTPEGYRLWVDVLLAERILTANNDSTSHTVHIP